MDDSVPIRNIRDLFSGMPQYLFTHLSRVELYVRSFCFGLALTGSGEVSMQDCLPFGQAAFFHDIGKLRVPTSILEMPGKLSGEDRMIIQRHPNDAKKILASLEQESLFLHNPGFYHLAICAAQFHHEWWDGARYPLGISGKSIPLIARITSICDAFDAITSARHYHNAQSLDEAFSQIQKHAGSQFDPVLSHFLMQHQSVFSDLLWFSTPNSAHIDSIGAEGR